MYASLNTPAANKLLHFAGEALSVRHAWVEGALDSAWRAVCELLTNPGFTNEQRRKFQRNWGKNPEWIPKRKILPGGAQGKAPEVDLFSGDSPIMQHLVYTENVVALVAGAEASIASGAIGDVATGVGDVGADVARTAAGLGAASLGAVTTGVAGLGAIAKPFV